MFDLEFKAERLMIQLQKVTSSLELVIGVWQGNVAQFNENSTYLMGWFRDYLWANSAQYNLFSGIP